MTENPQHDNSQKGQPAPKAGSKKVKQANHSRQKKHSHHDM